MRPSLRLLLEPPTLKDTGEITGYIAKFGVQSAVIYDENFCDGPFQEVIDPRFFDNSLRMNDIVCLVNHDDCKPLGRLSEPTLTLKVDDVGLWFSVIPPENTIGQDARVTVKRRDAKGCSFGFNVLRSTLVERNDGPPLVTLYDGDVFEVSVGVTFPAYLAASCTARSRPPERPLVAARSRGLLAHYRFVTRSRS